MLPSSYLHGRVRIRGGLVVAGILALVSTGARAAELRGMVVVPPTAAPGEALNPYAGTLGSRRDGGNRTGAVSSPGDVVVYLESEAPSTGVASGKTPRLVQRDQAFHPRVIGIPVGTTVEFPNEDLVFHNVFSYSTARRFDLGYYGKGKSKSVTFDKAGLVQVFCDIHRDMSAFIYVVDSAHVTQPDSRGQFVIAGVPPGRHTLVAWHPELGERRMQVEVGGDNAVVDIRF